MLDAVGARQYSGSRVERERGRLAADRRGEVMAALIDWHAHHTAPELVAAISERGGRAPKPDAFDGPDFGARVAAMDGAGVDVQLVCLGAGLNVDGLGLSAADALAFARQANDLIAERVA